MSYDEQVPWFATSNGIIDLKTSADFRDKKYTHNDINQNHTDKNSKSETPSNNLQEKQNSSNVHKSKLNSIGVGGLPPLINSERRQSKISLDSNGDPKKGPPPPKDNELYGDILVIPPIKQKQLEQDQDFPNFTYSRNLEWAWVSVYDSEES